MIFPHTAFIRVFGHILLIVLFMISLLSGIRLAFDSPYMPQALLNLAPEGNVFWWHEMAAYGWLALVGYGLFHWLRVYREQPNYYQRKNTFIQINYGLILLQCFSGLILYGNQVLLANESFNQWLLTAHYLFAAVFFVVVLVHMVEQLVTKSWPIIWAMFKPQNFNRKAALVITTIAGIAVGFWYFQYHFFSQLTAYYIPLDQEITIDGHFDEPSWQAAQSVQVLTVQGNDYFAATEVEVKMLYNGLSAYMALRWPDSSASYRHLPLLKTATGWQVQHDGFAKDDERTFYEDKMAIMLSRDAGLAGGYSVHLGKKPLAEHPQNRSGRGYHYTTDDSIRDVWHWKAVRVEHMSYLDDNHFGSPSAPCYACPRYKAGYRTDPKDSGAFRANWTWFLADGITPLRLPMADRDYSGDSMSWFDTVPYAQALDNLPIGTEMPSVLSYEGFEGDRANVSAKAHYQNGYWHLELARNLEAGSPFDLPIEDGIYLWFSPFDHAQSRHSYHLKPVRLTLEQHQ